MGYFDLTGRSALVTDAGDRAAADAAAEQAALPHIPTDGAGRVINVTSAAGLTGTLGQVNYSAAKAGLIGFTKSLAREPVPKNIMANALAPLAATPMTETIRTTRSLRPT